MTRSPGAGGVRSRERGLAGAWASGVASAVAYGLSPVVATLSYADGVSPAVLATLRGAFGGALIMGFAALTGRLRGLPLTATLGLALLCGPIFGLQLLAYLAAIGSTGAQVAVVLVHVYPVFVLLLAWLANRQRIGRPVAVLCAAMISGIALVAGAGSSMVTGAGATMALLSATGYAVYLVLGERWVREVGVVTAAGIVTIGAAVTTGTFAIVTDQNFALTAGGWWSVILQGLILVPAGVGGAFYAVRRLGSVPMSLIGLLEPIVGVAAATTILAERLSAIQWLGVTVILASCSLLPWATRGRPPHNQSGLSTEIERLDFSRRNIAAVNTSDRPAAKLPVPSNAQASREPAATASRKPSALRVESCRRVGSMRSKPENRSESGVAPPKVTGSRSRSTNQDRSESTETQALQDQHNASPGQPQSTGHIEKRQT